MNRLWEELNEAGSNHTKGVAKGFEGQGTEEIIGEETKVETHSK